MEWEPALEIVVDKTKHKRYRWLCSEENLNINSRLAYRDLMINMAKEYPSFIQMGKNLLSSAGKMIRSGFAMASDETYNRRLSICHNCPSNDFDKDQGRCFACGCFVKAKARFADDVCPKGHWAKTDEQLAEESQIKQDQNSIVTHPCGCINNDFNNGSL